MSALFVRKGKSFERLDKMPVSRRWPCTRVFGGCLYLFILWFSLNCFKGCHTQPSRPALPLKTEGGLCPFHMSPGAKRGLLFAFSSSQETETRESKASVFSL